MRTLLGTSVDESSAVLCLYPWPARRARNPKVLPRGVSQFSVTWRRGDPALYRKALESSLVEDLHCATPQRQFEYVMGRLCAREAMRALDLAPVDVPRNPHGAPRWPAGTVGAITHAQGFASAAVAVMGDVNGVGIDTEPVIPEARARAVEAVVACPIEVARGQAAGLSRLEALTLVFSIKESVFKCLYALAGGFFDFHDVRVVDINVPTRTFRARLVRTLSRPLPAGMILEGTFDIDERGIHTGLVLGLGALETGAASSSMAAAVV